MLDVRPTGYVAPIAEQEIGPLTPIVTVINAADEDARIFCLFRIYRESLGILEFSSFSDTTEIAHGSTLNLSALTPFSPGAPADHDFFIIAQLTVQSLTTGELKTVPLGQYFFDIKPAPMGPVPATHHTTHENGGMDPVDLTGMTGLTGTPQTPANHATTHEDGGADPLSVAGLHGELADDQPVLIHSADKHTETTPQTLTDQAAIDWDLALGGAAKVTLGGDRTMNAPTHMVDGANYSLRVIQDGTGTRLLTWDAAFRFPGGVEPALTAAINTEDIILFSCNGTNMDCTGMVNALA